jgi:isopenicillin-N N-acyltransferase like protein
MVPLSVVEISGSPRERGRAHGEALRELIRARDARWCEQIETGCAMPADRFIQRFLAETRFLPAIQRWTPGLLDEALGIAEGADLPYERILACQLMDEEWWWSEPLQQRHHCSGFAALHRGGAVAGQNMDLGAWMDGFQALLHIRDRALDLDSYVLTCAGMIGLCGMNSAGLGLCVNTLLDLNHRGDGLPVAFVTRGLLEHRSLAEAAAFLNAVPHASGQNFILAEPGALADFECSAAGAVRLSPTAPGRIWHTNHALASADLDPAHGGSGWADSARNSRARLAAVERRIADPERPIDLALARSTLASKDDARDPVSRLKRRADGTPVETFTFASVIWELGSEPVAHVAPGAPCSHDYRSFRFAEPMQRRAVAP